MSFARICLQLMPEWAELILLMGELRNIPRSGSRITLEPAHALLLLQVRAEWHGVASTGDASWSMVRAGPPRSTDGRDL